MDQTVITIVVRLMIALEHLLMLQLQLMSKLRLELTRNSLFAMQVTGILI